MARNDALEKRWRELEQEINARQPVVDESKRSKQEQELLRRVGELRGRYPGLRTSSTDGTSAVVEGDL